MDVSRYDHDPSHRVTSDEPNSGLASHAGYLAFLTERDGQPTFERRQLSAREAFFANLESHPIRARITVDRAAYLRNAGRRRPERSLDAHTLWLLATAKANNAERFAVGLADLFGYVTEDSHPIHMHVQLQEVYHTRLLAQVVHMFDLPVRAQAPPMIARVLVNYLLTVPLAWRLPVTGMAEMVGCVLFRALRDRGIALFAGDPPVVARIRQLYDEIIGDEISHVGYIAAQMSPRNRRLTRTLYRRFSVRLALQLPEVGLLFTRDELRQIFQASFSLDEMATHFPHLAYVAAPI